MVKKFFIFILISTAVCSAVSRHTKPRHRYPMYSVIAGSKASMAIQNQEIDRLQLPRIVDNEQLHTLEEQNELIKIAENRSIEIAPNIREDRRYLRPWAENFLENMAYEFSRKWNKPLRVNSAVRTMEQQRELRKHNRYAAREDRSSHLAGTTFDLAKRKYTRAQKQWIVNYLYNARQSGYVSAAEEPYCYHVFVKERYNEYYGNQNYSTFLSTQMPAMWKQ
jgi:hypothetical protein